MAYTAWSVVFNETPSAAKWNQLGENDAGFKDGTNIDSGAITTAKIADGAVTPAKLLAGTGTDWAWNDWTPTITGITVGNGSVNGRYIQIGKTVIGYIAFSMGSTSSLSDAKIDPPVTPNTQYSDVDTGSGTAEHITIGSATILDNGVKFYQAELSLVASDLTYIKLRTAVDGAPAVWNNVGTNTPMTWTTDDGFSGTFMYEAA